MSRPSTPSASCLRLASSLAIRACGRGDRPRHVEARHDAHAVVVGDDRVARPDELAAERHRHVDRAGRLLHGALRGHVRGPGGEAHVAQFLGVAQARAHDQAADAAADQRGGEQLAERAVAVRRRGGDDDDVARLGLLDGGVDHQVVARPAQHGERGARDARALLVRPDAPGPGSRCGRSPRARWRRRTPASLSTSARSARGGSVTMTLSIGSARFTCPRQVSRPAALSSAAAPR